MKSSPGWTCWFPVALLLLLASCGLRLFPEKEKIVLPSREQECLDQIAKLETEVQVGVSVEATRLALGRLFAAIDPDCSTKDRFFRAVLQKSRKNTILLTALGSAVYGGDLLTSREEQEGWRLAVWKEEVRKKMLERAERLRRLSRRGRVPEGLYQEHLQTMVRFATGYLDTQWRNVDWGDYPALDPSEIRVADLDYLSHSAATMMVYYRRYADHEVMGNLTNFEAMRTHLDHLIGREEDACGVAEFLADSGLSALALASPLELQTSQEQTDGPETARTTSSPAFLRTGDSEKSATDMLIRVPRNPEEPFHVWPSGRTYLLKPLPGGPKGIRVLKTRVRWPEEENVSPRLRVLRLLGKAKPQRSDLLTVGLENPRRFRMVAFIDTETFRKLEEKCGVRIPTVVNGP